MTQHTLNNYSVLIPDIPEGATDLILDLFPEDNFYSLSYITKIDDEESGFCGEWEESDIPLPPGEWQLLKLSEVPEELAGEMCICLCSQEIDIDQNPIGEKEYTYWCEKFAGTTAHASLTSWVRAQGVDGDCYLLIKKN